MRVRRVRGAALAFTALFVGAAALVARFAGAGAPTSAAQDVQQPPVSGADPQDGLDGAALFAEHCALCHEVDELTPPLRGSPSAGAVLALLDFLDGHGEGDAAADRAMVRFLLRAAR